MTLLMAFIPAQAQIVTAEGVIVSSDGKSVVIRRPAGTATIIIKDDTRIEVSKGLVGIRTDSVSAATLLPGLSIKVEVTIAGDQNIAKTIRFSEDDLQRATEIQAALEIPQQQAAALRERVRVQEQTIANQEKQIANQERQIAANRQSIATGQAAVDKRFSELAEYDMKDEFTILFDVNSSTLSDKAKKDLQDLAAKAKTYKGYLIQVAGYTDADGGASLNQQLSDRRAEVVANYLRQSCDVAMSRLLAPVAMSSAKAVASNETAKGKAENRRVVVKIAVNRGISAL